MSPAAKFERDLPASAETERVILGAVLLNNAAFDEVKLVLKPKDFSLESHQRIAAVMGRLAKQERAIDLVTLVEELRIQKSLEAIGGVTYLSSLTEGLPRRPAIGEYLRIVKEDAQRRSVILACESAIAQAYDRQDSPMDVVSDLVRQTETISVPAVKIAEAEVANWIIPAMDNLNTEYRERVSPAVPSGNSWFDHKMGGGYKQGKTTIVAARPKVGKTAWLMMSAVYNLQRDWPVTLFSLEMDKEEINRNLIPYVVPVSNFVANRPWAQTPEQNRLCNEAASTIAGWPLRIYDGAVDIDEICWTIDRDADKNGVRLFGADHLTLIDGPGRDTRERVNNISGRIRKKIKHKKAAFVLLAQLAKVPREYANKPPLPSDIKESGNPAEDAHAVLMLHRGWDEDKGRMSISAELNLAYVRGGGGTPGTTKAHFDVQRLAFEAEAEMDYENYYA